MIGFEVWNHALASIAQLTNLPELFYLQRPKYDRKLKNTTSTALNTAANLHTLFLIFFSIVTLP